MLCSMKILKMCTRIGNRLQLFKQLSTWSTMDTKERTAGIIVIGDEILKGQVHDTNSFFVAKKLYNLGVKVLKISVVGDDSEAISKEVKTFSEKYTYVITTGGIGPTHDDITFTAVANAFGESVVPHPELVKLISSYYKTEDLSSAPMKMAHVPKSAHLKYGSIDGKKTNFPNVSIGNVFMFPGIPQLMERLFVSLYEELFGGSTRKFFMKELFINAPESQIADTLSATARNFPHVTIGSYPKLFNCYYTVEITVESESEQDTNRVHDELRSLLRTVVVEYDKNPLEEAYEKLQKLIETEPKVSAIVHAVALIKEAVQTYRTEELCMYFDGSLESIALLHLYYAVLQKYSSGSKINAACIKAQNPLELQSFLQHTINRYGLHFASMECSLESFNDFLKKKDPSIKAILAGFTKLEGNFSNSTPKWILPLAEWDRKLLWDFIHSLNLPYCPLFKEEKNGLERK